MRLNTFFKVLGLGAALAMPLALVGCDDDDTVVPNDAAVDGLKPSDTAGNTDVAPGGKLDTNTPTDTGTSDTKTDTGTADAAGDAANAG